MKIYLAGTASYKKLCLQNPPRFLLESFFYFQDWQSELVLKANEFLLDSGAFTFMQSNKTRETDWDTYLERYADFIKRNNVAKFFELDIDSVVGYERVLELRQKLERMTGRRCIPVWHKSRGIDEYRRMCDAYDYVAIGGIVSQEILPSQYKFLPTLIAEGHKKSAKVHGLGFTSTSYYNTVHFDSVDSTTWTIGARMGNVCYFNGQGMRQYKKGKSPKDMQALHEMNYVAWLKFQQYAEEHL